MQFIIGALFITAAILWSSRKMSQALTDAVDRLKAEVAETAAAISAKLQEIANNTSDQEAADAINAQAQALDDLQTGILAPAPTGEDTSAA